MSDLSKLFDDLNDRADARCELCGSSSGLRPVAVTASEPPTLDDALFACDTCGPHITGEQPADPRHWFCLQEAAWSDVIPVQIASLTLLQQLRPATWAVDLLEQVFPDAAEGGGAEGGLTPTVDAHGTELFDGDSVTLIKDLDVKGANFTAKRGTLVKGIRLSEDPGLVEGRVNKVAIFLKTEFIKKA